MKSKLRSHLHGVYMKCVKPLIPSAIAVVVFEVLIACCGFDLFAILVENMTITVATFVLSVLLAIRDVLGYDKVKEKQNDAREKDDGESSLYAMAGAFLKDVYWVGRKSKFISFLLVAVLLLLAPSAVAHCRPIGHGLNYAAEFIEELRDMEPESAVVSEDTGEELTADSTQPSTVEPTDPPESTPDLETEPPAVEYQFLEEPDRCYELSDAERDRLYFKFGLYAVEDWSDEAAMTSAVLAMVREFRAEKAANEFDKHAPQDTQKAVAEIETDYAKMSSSRDLDNVIDIQMTAWSEYPKYGLAWMLTNNFQEYGDRYNEIGGCFETIEYYYGQSIFWAWTTLTYESAESHQVRECLRYISMRYHDIAVLAEEGSQVKLRAEALYRAFKAIENEELP